MDEASLVAQLVKNPPAMRETWVQSLGWEDLLEKGRATHSSILSWRFPWTVQSLGWKRVRHNLATEQQQQRYSRSPQVKSLSRVQLFVTHVL